MYIRDMILISSKSDNKTIKETSVLYQIDELYLDVPKNQTKV